MEPKQSPAEVLKRIAPEMFRISRRYELGLTIPKDKTRVYFDWYIDSTFWNGLSAVDRHLARMLAIHRSAEHPPVFSHVSAAVLHGLPLYADLSQPIHVTRYGGHGTGRISIGLTRHRTRLAETEIVERSGLLCTTPDRTILDLCRTAAAETALSAADSYLRSEFRHRRSIDDSHLDEWRDEMARQAIQLKGARGIRAVPRVLALADPRKDSVLESLSHLQLDRLGFEVELQLPVRTNRRTYFVDFGFSGLPFLGECDGKWKYEANSLGGAAGVSERVYLEKLRDDEIYGVTGRRVLHWSYADAANTTRLAQRLQSFGVPVPRPLC